MSRILIEALAIGRPIITSNVPGCRDAIIPNKTGLLIKPRDVYSLVVAIEKLIFDNNLCMSMGSEGRKFAENKFSINETLDYPLREARENFEKEYLITQLKKFSGNISKTARFVGMERSALHRKLKLLGVKDLN